MKKSQNSLSQAKGCSILLLFSKFYVLTQSSGPLMLVCGGINEENSEVHEDLSVYDINNRRWIGVSFTNSDKKISIGKRYKHSCTAVVNQKIDQKVRFY